MHTLLIIAISLVTYGIGAVAARRALRVRGDLAVHALEALQAAAVLPMAVLVRRTEYSATYYLVMAGAVCVIGAVMAGASLLTEGSTVFTNAATSQSADSADFNFFRAVVDYEIQLLQSAWGIGGYLLDSRRLLASTR